MVCDLEAGVWAEFPRVGAHLLAGQVEPANAVAAMRKDHHVLSVLERLLPVVQQAPGQLVLGLGQDHAVMLSLQAHGLLDLEAAHQLQRLLFPLGLLAAVLHELTGAEP
jgi:hypothetical protein